MTEPRETSLGGQAHAFPTTDWTALSSLGEAPSQMAREVLGRLLSSYWRPIYVTIRRGWGRSVEDAKDLTQSFLTSLVEGDLASRVDPAKGRFRNWLKAALKHFLSQSRRDESALKRGGGRILLSLDGRPEDLEPFDTPDPRHLADPSSLFDREWARELFRRSLEKLQAELTLQGKEVCFEVFRQRYIESPGEEPLSYREIANRLHITPFDVGNYLKVARTAIKEIVAREVSGYARNADEVEEELTELLGES